MPKWRNLRPEKPFKYPVYGEDGYDGDCGSVSSCPSSMYAIHWRSTGESLEERLDESESVCGHMFVDSGDRRYYLSQPGGEGIEYRDSPFPP